MTYGLEALKKWVKECDDKGFVIDSQRHNIIKELLNELAKEREAREEAKKEIAHQKERKQSIGNELNKWRSRAIAHRSRAEAAKAQVAVLSSVLLNIIDDPFGCPYCHSGQLIGKKKEHFDSCGYGDANVALSNLPDYAAKYQAVVEAAKHIRATCHSENCTCNLCTALGRFINQSVNSERIKR